MSEQRGTYCKHCKAFMQDVKELPEVERYVCDVCGKVLREDQTRNIAFMVGKTSMDLCNDCIKKPVVEVLSAMGVNESELAAK